MTAIAIANDSLARGLTDVSAGDEAGESASRSQSCQNQSTLSLLLIEQAHCLFDPSSEAVDAAL